MGMQHSTTRKKARISGKVCQKWLEDLDGEEKKLRKEISAEETNKSTNNRWIKESTGTGNNAARRSHAEALIISTKKIQQMEFLKAELRNVKSQIQSLRRVGGIIDQNGLLKSMTHLAQTVLLRTTMRSMYNAMIKKGVLVEGDESQAAETYKLGASDEEVTELLSRMEDHEKNKEFEKRLTDLKST